MSLLDRLLGNELPKLPIHTFMAALAEYKRGAITGAQVVSAFALSVTEQTALATWLLNLDTSSIDRALIHDCLLLAEAELYTKTQVQARLGV